MTEEPSPQGHQPLIEHLVELRIRLMRAFTAVGIGTIIGWFYSDRLLDIIRHPAAPYLKGTNGGLVFTGVMDDFMAHVKIAFMAGVIATCPYWIYQLWKFVAPGLYAKERKYSLAFMFFGSTLFLSGVNFAYFLVYPAAFKFLLTFGGAKDLPMITINQYLSFFFTTTLLFGVAFELPLIMTLLGMMGIIDKKFLTGKRRFAIVVLAGISAILAPPDFVSMILMLCPMLLLYELGVILVGIVEKRRKQAEQSS